MVIAGTYAIFGKLFFVKARSRILISLISLARVHFFSLVLRRDRSPPFDARARLYAHRKAIVLHDNICYAGGSFNRFSSSPSSAAAACRKWSREGMPHCLLISWALCERGSRFIRRFRRPGIFEHIWNSRAYVYVCVEGILRRFYGAFKYLMKSEQGLGIISFFFCFLKFFLVYSNLVTLYNNE